MKGAALAVFAGAVFAIGLAVGGMTIPAKVTGFLDVGGAWDPTLALVMAGAIAVYAPVVRIVRRRHRPLASEQFHWPTPRVIDARLIGGAAIFGVGWGLSGYCPGPALTSIGSGAASALVFVAAMIAGIAVTRAVDRARR
ncbi:MAG TPA: DUF6691 family protein [Kofleriaceae bacterium]